MKRTARTVRVKRVGLIGLGLMGAAFAQRLRAAGFPLPFTRVHRRLLEAAERAGLGAMDNSALIKVLAGSKPRA